MNRVVVDQVGDCWKRITGCFFGEFYLVSVELECEKKLEFRRSTVVFVCLCLSNRVKRACGTSPEISTINSCRTAGVRLQNLRPNITFQRIEAKLKMFLLGCILAARHQHQL